MSQDRIYPATQLQKRRMRRMGQVARSLEINSVVVILAAILAIRSQSVDLFALFRRMVGVALEQMAKSQSYGPSDIGGHIWAVAFAAALPLGLVLGAVGLAAIAAQLAQVGFMFSGQILKPQGQRISLTAGLGRMFSKSTVIEMIKTVVKLGAIFFIVGTALRDNATALQLTDRMPVSQAMQVTAVIAFDIVIRLVLVFGVVAAADLFYQRYRFNQQSLMTRADFVRDIEEMDGQPEARSMIRQRQNERRRANVDRVKEATVVVRNPQHLAVAIRYDSSTPTPIVVAKGAGIWARAILDAAAASGIPAIEHKPLAQMLYRGVEVGAEIPYSLWTAVIEIIGQVAALERAKARR